MYTTGSTEGRRPHPRGGGPTARPCPGDARRWRFWIWIRRRPREKRESGAAS